MSIVTLMRAMKLTICVVSFFKVYSTSIYMSLSRESFGEDLQPSRSPLLQIYAALKGSFGAVFAEPAAMADGLNPFTISHTARTISCTPSGACKAT